MKHYVGLVLLCAASAASGQTLNLPPRPTNAPSGSELIQRLAPLTLEAREQEMFSQVAAGNVPDFLRKLCSVTVTNSASGRTNIATFYVAPDYLAIGSDADYFLTPLTPDTAQRIADLAGCALPTRKMVNDIFTAAEVKLAPVPIPPGPRMTTVPEFAKHNDIVKTQRAAFLKSAPLGSLVAGHKKDVVTTAKLAQSPGKVAIYGWHQTNGTPIQPLYLGHTVAWVDYSHGIRLVHQSVSANGSRRFVGELLADEAWAGLLSDEGLVTGCRYATNTVASATPAVKVFGATPPRPHLSLADFKPSRFFGEQTLSFTLEPGVKIHLNAPVELGTNGEVLLVFYALPNGNTTDQTIGKVLKPGDDWHSDIQHIGAQTRWLRRHVPECAIIVAYLENDLRSWPAWRKQHGDTGIPALFDAAKRIFQKFRLRVILTGHSGGGSLTFGFLNAVDSIPEDVERIAFLDSNYAYEPVRHEAKLVGWLQASEHHFLFVLAYNDAAALLEGEPFVSATGGTWGRSRAMLEDLGKTFEFSHQEQDGLWQHSAANGRIQLLLKENPERQILHTVQVERNGFIHAMLTGTPHESVRYSYFGPRVYASYIAPD